MSIRAHIVTNSESGERFLQLYDTENRSAPGSALQITEEQIPVDGENFFVLQDGSGNRIGLWQPGRSAFVGTTEGGSHRQLIGVDPEVFGGSELPRGTSMLFCGESPLRCPQRSLTNEELAALIEGPERPEQQPFNGLRLLNETIDEIRSFDLGTEVRSLIRSALTVIANMGD